MGVTYHTERDDVESTCALLVIDMQIVAFDGEVTQPIIDGAQLLESISSLIDSCRGKRIPIVYLQNSAATGQPYAMDVHGWEIHPQISPHGEDRVVTKRNSSGFDGTNLANVLRGLGIDKVLICGIWSEHCVANTSIDAVRLGFEVFVAADGHGTVASTVREARKVVTQQNSRLRLAGASVCTVSELLNQNVASLPSKRIAYSPIVFP